METLKALLQFEGSARIAIGLLAVSAIVWTVAMVAALFFRKTKGSRPRRGEIAVVVASLALAGSMAFVRSATAEPEPEPAPVATPTRAGGTGTCASVRRGMDVKKVRELLGEPTLDRAAEDSMGPGATVMVFDESRCIVHLIDGTVDQIE